MMSLDRYMVKFFYLAVFSCVLVTAFLVGCGGGNNPSGPASMVAPNNATGTINIPDPASGTIAVSYRTVVGKIKNALTGEYVAASESIQISYSEVAANATVTPMPFAPIFRTPALKEGYYQFTIKDNGNSFKDAIREVEINASSPAVIELNFSLIPKNYSANSTLNYYGKVIDVATGKGIQFVNVTARSASGYTIESTTLVDGTFLLRQLASGTYTVNFDKSGFASLSVDLSILENSLSFGSTIVATISDVLVDEADLKDATKTVYEEQLSKFGHLIDGKLVNLKSVLISPVIETTGALAGILMDQTKNPIEPFDEIEKFDLIFDDDIRDQYPPVTIIQDFTTIKGYFMIKNLSKGWYMIIKDGVNWRPLPIKDNNQKIIGYTIVSKAVFDTYTGTNGEFLESLSSENPSALPAGPIYHEVGPGVTTIIPEVDRSATDF